MKLLIYILLSITLQANEFPLVQPYAVERVSQEIAPTLQKESIVQKAMPKKKPKATKTGTTTNTKTLDIKFLPKSARIQKPAMQKIRQFATYLLENKSYQAVLYCYTDNEATKKENFLLSQKRADNIIDVLQKLKISVTRLTAIGMGEVTDKNNDIQALIIK